jgi:hypothetical protein
MSFRCDFCSAAQPAGTVPQVVVTKTRPREYHGIPGSEIAQEKRACADCFATAPASVEVLAPKPALYTAAEPRFDESTDH